MVWVRTRVVLSFQFPSQVPLYPPEQLPPPLPPFPYLKLGQENGIRAGVIFSHVTRPSGLTCLKNKWLKKIRLSGTLYQFRHRLKETKVLNNFS